jgi:hypothetical protein
MRPSGNTSHFDLVLTVISVKFVANPSVKNPENSTQVSLAAHAVTNVLLWDFLLKTNATGGGTQTRLYTGSQRVGLAGNTYRRVCEQGMSDRIRR